jgi:hypothetical protein
MKINFVVGGVPPKKDGANSMWKKPAELPRLLALRRAAHLAMGDRVLAAVSVRLTLRIYADRGAGDLDNFITGVCDGLMPVSRNAPIDPLVWSGLPEGARPDGPIVYSDDSCISRIDAERLPPGPGGPHYEVELEWA